MDTIVVLMNPPETSTSNKHFPHLTRRNRYEKTNRIADLHVRNDVQQQFAARPVYGRRL